MGQAAALSGLIGLTGPLAIVLKPPPVTWLGLISANIGYFIYAPFLRRPRMKALWLLVAVIFTTLSLPAADWPQWRGPRRTGISQETGLLKEWLQDGPKPTLAAG